MKRTKRILSLLLAVVMIVGMFASPAGATASAPQETKAQILHALGLFKGYDNTGTNFGLSDQVTREQSLIFLIRLLGEEKAAMAWTGTQAYQDVPTSNYAHLYIGYAKEKGYTMGIGNNQFGLGRNATMKEMATLALRGLGYSDASGVKEFTVNTSLTFAASLGILDSDKEVTPFTRGDAVDILDGTVAAKIKEQEYTLLDKLLSSGAVTEAQAKKAAEITGEETAPVTDEKKDPVTGDKTDPAPGDKTVAVTGVALDQTSLTLTVDKSAQLVGTVSPAKATNKKLTWSSSSSDIAEVDANGLIIGLKPGIVTITVKTADGGKTATCKVTVASLGEEYTKKSVTLYNYTDKSVKDIRIFSTQNKSWSSNLATFSVLPKTGTYISVPVSNRDYTYDIKFTYADGTDITFTAYNFKSFKDATSLYAYLDKGTTPKLSTTVPITDADIAAKSKRLADRFNAAEASYKALVVEINKLPTLSGDSKVTATLKQIDTQLTDMGKTIGSGTDIYSDDFITASKNTLYKLEGLMTDLDLLVRAEKPATSFPVSVIFKNQAGEDIYLICFSTDNGKTWSEPLGNVEAGKEGKFDYTLFSNSLMMSVKFMTWSGQILIYNDCDFRELVSSGSITILATEGGGISYY